MLAPKAPHIAEELWHRAGGTGSIDRQPWPSFSPELAAAEVVTMADATPIVFVVDDDVSVRESLEPLIGLEGWQVETFASAEAFLSRPRGFASLWIARIPNCGPRFPTTRPFRSSRP